MIRSVEFELTSGGWVTIFLSGTLTVQKSNEGAIKILNLLEAFRTPYYAPDKLAPLLYSVGLALKLDA